MSDTNSLFGFLKRGSPDPSIVPDPIEPPGDTPPGKTARDETSDPAQPSGDTPQVDTDAPPAKRPAAKRPAAKRTAEHPEPAGREPAHRKPGNPGLAENRRPSSKRQYRNRNQTDGLPETHFTATRPKFNAPPRGIVQKTISLDHPGAINFYKVYYPAISGSARFVTHFSSSSKILNAKPYWQPLAGPADRADRAYALDALLYTGGTRALIDRLIRVAETAIDTEQKLVLEAIARYRDTLAADGVTLSPSDPDSAWTFEVEVYSPLDTKVLNLFTRINELLILLQANWIESKIPTHARHRELAAECAENPLKRIRNTVGDLHAYLHDRWPHIVRNRHGYTFHKLRSEYRQPPDSLRHPPSAGPVTTAQDAAEPAPADAPDTGLAGIPSAGAESGETESHRTESLGTASP